MLHELSMANVDRMFAFILNRSKIIMQLSVNLDTLFSSFLLKSWIFCRKLSGSTPLYWKGRNTPVTGSGALMSCLMYLHKNQNLTK